MRVIRSEQVDTRALLNGRPGDANHSDPKLRMKQRERVLNYWPDDIIMPIRQGTLEAPPLRLLLDPTGWTDVPREKVYAYVRHWLAERSRWPSIDGMHRQFGRVSNHRGPDEVKDQPSLLAP